ncbi:MAG: CDP-alcohol phosphatidyltransferase family protein [Candidatus Comchoanobacterales bacterium]
MVKALPNLATVANAVCGLSAVFLALNGYVHEACYCIVLAAIMDSMDGRLARALSVSSKLGAMLDDHADVVSFGLAPTIILWQYSLNSDYQSIAFVIGVLYVLAVVYRICRCTMTKHNFQNAYLGLASPLGAGLALLPFYYAGMLSESTVISVFPLLISFSIACTLMVLPYPIYIYRNVPSKFVYSSVILALLLFGVALGSSHSIPALVIGFYAFFFMAMVFRQFKILLRFNAIKWADSRKLRNQNSD